MQVPDAHIQSLIDNVKEVDRLRGIHSQITKPGPGRKYEVEVLHKSGIVLLVACWEAFVEDCAAAGLDHLIQASADPSKLPLMVRERVASQCTGLKVWSLANAGWKTVLRDNMKAVLAKTTGALNTPRTTQVDEIFHKTLELSSVSSAWNWKGRSVMQARAALDRLVTLRGSIAHRVATSKRVRLKDVRDARDLVFRLAVSTHNRVSDFLLAETGTTPWVQYTFQGRSRK